jgi:hypothetical protein
LNGYNRDGFIAILNILHNIFGSASLFIWYTLQLFINSYLLSKLLVILFYKNRGLILFILFNPFFIIFYSGIFKEVILINLVIWSSYGVKYIKKIITILFFGIIRIHLTPFIIFIFTRFKKIVYFLLAIISLLFISYFNVIDYNLINGSVSEIRGLNKSDFPILILPNLSIFPLLINTLIIIFGFLFISKIFIKVLYLFTILYILIIYFKYKFYKQFFAFILGLLPYSFILTNGGTALRIITFLFVVTISNAFISNYLNKN